MTLPSGLNYDFIKTVATILCPGALATAPYCVMAAHKWETVGELMSQSPGLAFAVLLLLVVGAGMVLEDIGSEIEDKILPEPKGKDIQPKNWEDYLKIAFEVEPIGHRYLRTIVARMKFELGMLSAHPFFLVGALCLKWRTNYISYDWMLALCVVTIASGFFFLWQAISSSILLARTRSNLLVGINVVGVLKPDAERKK